jgi:glycosyltransferase involved in cell wall biosynthesis
MAEPRILHVIVDLERGGAQAQLYRLLSKAPNSSGVFSITGSGPLKPEIQALGVRVYGGAGAWPAGLVRSFRRAVRDHRADVICGWMYHGNLLSLASSVGNNGPAVMWNIRHSLHDISHEKLTTRSAIRAGAMLSFRPKRIVYNSAVAAQQHENLGYRRRCRGVIPNGFDTQRFRPDATQRQRARAGFGVPGDQPLIGVVGRAHPMKNHRGFVSAVAIAIRHTSPFRVVMIGAGVDAPGAGLGEQVRRLGLEGVIDLQGERSNLEGLYPALDLLVLPSAWGEAFPNVVGEAMACGVPCLVTDVGSAAEVVGGTGFVVPSPAPNAVAEELVRTLSVGKPRLHALGVQARRRVERLYSIDAMAAKYRELFHDVTAGKNLHTQL